MRDFVINGECLVKVKGTGTLGVSGLCALVYSGTNPPTSFDDAVENVITAGGQGGEIANDPINSGYDLTNCASLWELGLTSDQIRVIPKYFHQDRLVDDYGPNVPAETTWYLGECQIQMTLLHYDPVILEACVAESMCGKEGFMVRAGRPMGQGKPLFASGNHYISLNLLSPVLNYPWHFPSAYLADMPMTVPLGTEKSAVVLNWRAIPYGCMIGNVATFRRVDSFLGNPTAEFISGFVQIRGSGTQEVVSASGIVWDHILDT